MPITIPKKMVPKVKAEEAEVVLPKEEIEYVEQAPPLNADLTDRIDNLGKMQKQLEKAKAFIKDYTKLQAETVQVALALFGTDVDDDDTFEVHGKEFKLAFGVKGKAREVTNKEKLIELLGADVYIDISDVKLKDIDNYLTLPQREEVLTTSRTSRSVSVEKA